MSGAQRGAEQHEGIGETGDRRSEIRLGAATPVIVEATTLPVDDPPGDRHVQDVETRTEDDASTSRSTPSPPITTFPRTDATAVGCTSTFDRVRDR